MVVDKKENDEVRTVTKIKTRSRSLLGIIAADKGMNMIEYLEHITEREIKKVK